MAAYPSFSGLRAGCPLPLVCLFCLLIGRTVLPLFFLAGVFLPRQERDIWLFSRLWLAFSNNNLGFSWVGLAVVVHAEIVYAETIEALGSDWGNSRSKAVG